MRELKVLLIIISFSFFALSSCDKGNKNNETTQKFLVDYELYTPSVPFSVETAKAALKTFGYEDVATLLKYDIQIYKVTYKTEFEGDTILVSGVVAAPVPQEKKEEFPVLSYQHGTIVRKADAPSLNIDNEFMTYVASTGIVVVMADYVGFGASASESHPYMNNEYTVNAVLDMIRASKEFVSIEKPCDVNNKLFMFGYSQGGSATLAALSAIENNNANSDISVTGTSCGSGAYDLAQMRKWIMKQARYEQPFYIAYMLESFNKYSGVVTPYSKVFSEEFATDLSSQFDGIKSGDQINAFFGTTHVGELFADDFENDAIFETDEDYLSLTAAFEENKVSAWPTNSSIWLFYGSEDLWVPGEQSLRMLQQFQTTGTSANVKLKRIEGGNHISAFVPSLTQSLEWFLSE